MNSLINKITEGNAFALNIRQAVWRTLGGVIQPLLASELVDVHLYVGSGSSKSTATEYPVTADGDTISAIMPATLKRGVYRTWLTAIYQGREVASACEYAFEIVPFDERKGVFAPERIDGEPCVYLQGVSMSDAELEAQKTYYRALIKQKEEELKLLAKEREKLTNVAMQLDGVDESLEGISETLDGVAKEDTQLEIKKAVDLIKTEISIDDKLSIRNAIELKGGQSVYKNPENPALLELAKNVGTIPQKFMTLEPEGVRYDDPIEWSVFQGDLARDLAFAKAFQNKIDKEEGIPSILNSDVRYNGFLCSRIFVDTSLSNGNTRYLQLSKNEADAYILSYSGDERILIEFNEDEDVKVINIDFGKISDDGCIYLVFLYKEDEYKCSIERIGNGRIGNTFIGGHPLSVRFSKNNNQSYLSVVQLNITDRTDFYLNMYSYMSFLRNKSGIVQSASNYIYLSEMENILNFDNDIFISRVGLGLYMPKLSHIEFLKINDVLDLSYLNLSNIQTINILNLLTDSLTVLDLSNLKEIVTNTYNGVNRNYNVTSKYLSRINYDSLERVWQEGGRYSAATLYNYSILIKDIILPKLRISNSVLVAYSCGNLERVFLPELEQAAEIETIFGGSTLVERCENLIEFNAPKLKLFYSYGKAVINNCPKTRRIIVGDIYIIDDFDTRNAGLFVCKDLIMIKYAEIVTRNQNLRSWQPTNAINDTISTLVEDGEEFANNREKFLWNFRNYIIAMLHDYAGTGETRTLTLHSMVANVLTDEDKLAITNKGWILSIV